MSPNDIGGYRGRRTASDVLKFIAVVLAVLVVMAIVLLLLVQRYLVYTDDGVRLELPPFLSFLQTEEEPDGPDLSNVTMVELPAEPAPEPEPGAELGTEPGSEPGPEPEPDAPLSALQLSLEDLEAGIVPELLEEAGANALILEMKPPQGELNWFSGEALAELEGINASDRGINQLLRDWNEGGVYTVARVSCLRDNTLPYRDRDLAVRATYGNWQDDRSTRWLDPAEPEVQSYLAGLCGELARMGFDEILLESCTFPTRGNLRSITGLQSGTARMQTIQGSDGLLEQIRAAIEPCGTALSVLLDGPLPEQGSGGLTRDGLRRLFQRVWLPKPEGPGEEPTEAELARTVYVVSELEEGLAAHQAVLMPDSPVTSPARS